MWVPRHCVCGICREMPTRQCSPTASHAFKWPYSGSMLLHVHITSCTCGATRCCIPLVKSVRHGRAAARHSRAAAYPAHPASTALCLQTGSRSSSLRRKNSSAALRAAEQQLVRVAQSPHRGQDAQAADGGKCCKAARSRRRHGGRRAKDKKEKAILKARAFKEVRAAAARGGGC